MKNSHTGSPGVTTLNKAGMAINKENNGINTHVLKIKKPIGTFEQTANTKHKRYSQPTDVAVFKETAVKINSKNVTVLIRGSRPCKNPLRTACSSHSTASFKKDTALKIVRSMKLLFLTKLSIFLSY